MMQNPSFGGRGGRDKGTLTNEGDEYLSTQWEPAAAVMAYSHPATFAL